MIATHRRLASIVVTACCAISAGGALAARGSAATLAANEACYVNVGSDAAQMTVAGAGWVPGSTVHLTGGTASATTTADAAGNVTFSTGAPKLSSTDPGTKATRLTATADNPDGSRTMATLKVTSANLAVSAKPLSVHNIRTQKVTFSFSGFVPGKRIYGYYLRQKVVAKVKFGKAHGPCGVLKQKALLYPGGRPRKDKYKVTFEDSSRYDKNAFPRVTGTLKILHF